MSGVTDFFAFQTAGSSPITLAHVFLLDSRGGHCLSDIRWYSPCRAGATNRDIADRHLRSGTEPHTSVPEPACL
jgi:hypothetical protein